MVPALQQEWQSARVTPPAAWDDDLLAAQESLRRLTEEHAQTLTLLDRTAALRVATSEVVDHLGAEMSFAAQREGPRSAVIRSLHGARGRSLADLEVPLGRGLGGYVLELAGPTWVPEYATASRISHEFDAPVGAEGLVGVLAVPLLLGQEVLGVVYAGFRQRHEFGDRMVDDMLRLGRRTAMSMHVADRASSRTTAAVNAERQRVAAELHDTLGAMLFAIGAQVRDLRGQYGGGAGGGDALVDRLRAIEDQLSEAGAALRESLSGLHAAPSELTLSMTLHADVQAFRTRTGLAAQVVLLSELPPLDEHRTAVLVAAAREALLNVEKHSGASSVVVTVARISGGVLVAVTDNGRGPAGDDSGDGLGLVSARDRVERLGGRLSLTSEDGDGATLRAWVPER